MTKSKLDTGLESSPSKKTLKLRFTDYSIDKFKSDYKDKKKKYYLIFDSEIKGLKLLCVKHSGNKFLHNNSGSMRKLTTRKLQSLALIILYQGL
jgi:hypothetical protein